MSDNKDILEKRNKSSIVESYKKKCINLDKSSAKIKSAIIVCELPVVKFKTLKGAELLPKMPDLVYKKLSNDQNSEDLYRIVNALISGDLPAGSFKNWRNESHQMDNYRIENL